MAQVEQESEHKFAGSPVVIRSTCLSSIETASIGPDPLNWRVTEEMLIAQVRKARSTKYVHLGPARCAVITRLKLPDDVMIDHFDAACAFSTSWLILRKYVAEAAALDGIALVGGEQSLVVRIPRFELILLFLAVDFCLMHISAAALAAANITKFVRFFEISA